MFGVDGNQTTILLKALVTWTWILFYLFVFFYFLPHSTVYGDLPGPGIEPKSPAVEAQCLNHWTTREVLG